ncbi:MAG: aminopeptidase P family N-terminal domain-containing protein [Desulfomicrobium escambiense]|nr:aminopeptidase P family N-terminal domain-containing protein [Desulfomicrobium escambiense]
MRATLGREGLDALVVFHLPNVRYLTGFAGSTAIAVLGRDDILLITDGRYVTEVEARVLPNCPGLRLLKVDPTYDATLAAHLRACGCPRVGFESAHVTVKRFDALTAALRDAPSRGRGRRPSSPPSGWSKRPGSARTAPKSRRSAAPAPSSARSPARWSPGCGRGSPSGRWRRTSTTGSGGAGSSARPSTRSSRRAPTAPSRTRGRATGGCSPATWSCWTSGASTTDTAWISPERSASARRAPRPGGSRRGRGGADGGHPGGQTVGRRDRRRRGGEGRAGSAGGSAPPSAMPRGMAWGSRFTRSRGSGRGGPTFRACRRPDATTGSNPAWCSPSNRARTCRVSAACASKTMCS